MWQPRVTWMRRSDKQYSGSTINQRVDNCWMNLVNMVLHILFCCCCSETGPLHKPILFSTTIKAAIIIDYHKTPSSLSVIMTHKCHTSLIFWMMNTTVLQVPLSLAVSLLITIDSFAIQTFREHLLLRASCQNRCTELPLTTGEPIASGSATCPGCLATTSDSANNNHGAKSPTPEETNESSRAGLLGNVRFARFSRFVP